MNNPLLSIIIPVYKVEDYIKQCVDSVLNQTFDDFEVILVNDGSPDNCPQICDDYAIENNRVRVIHKPNGGLSDARNAGIKEAKGDYLMFIDSDDFLSDKYHLSNISKIIADNNDLDVILLRNMLYYEDVDTFFTDHTDLSKAVVENPNITQLNLNKLGHPISSAWRNIVRRNLITQNEIFFTKGLTGEDSDWYIHLSTKVSKYYLYNEPCYVYRQNRVGSITNSLKIKNFNDQFYIQDKWIAALKNNNLDENLVLAMRGFLAYLLSVVILITPQLEKNNRSQVIKEIEKRKDIFNYSLNSKVKYIGQMIRFLGVSNTAKILNILYNLRLKIRRKG